MKFSTLCLMISTFFGGMYTQTLGGLTQAQRDVLNTLEVVYLDDCVSGPGYKTLRVKDANLQIVNGLNQTESANGLGNLIIGYNEDLGGVCHRGGSHSFITGVDVEYNEFCSILNGFTIESQDAFQTMLSTNNSIIVDGGEMSAIIGGTNHSIGEQSSAILGGDGNTTVNPGAVVTGGVDNTASGTHSVVSGGNTRTASGTDDWVAGTLFEDN